MSGKLWWEVEINNKGENPNPRGDYSGDDNIIPEAGVEQTPTRPVRPVEPEVPEGKSEDDFETPNRVPPRVDPGQTRSQGGTANPTEPNPKPSDNSSVGAPQGNNAELGGGLNYTTIQDHPPEKSPFTETRTVVHEFVGYLSLNSIGKTIKQTEAGPEQGFWLNLNQPYDLVNTTFVDQTPSNAAPKFGPAVTMAAEGTTFASPGTNARTQFPRRFVGATGFNTAAEAGACQPAYGTWTRWYQKMYRYYHVIETNWKITAEYANFDSSGNCEGTRKRHVYLCHHPESYVQANNSDIVPNQIVSVSAAGAQVVRMIGLHQLKKFKNVKINEIENPKNISVNANTKTTITGTWFPGMREGSVRNLQDIKQWYATGAKPSPNWAEREKFVAILGADSDYVGNINIKIEMSMKVQYKDLKEPIKYAAAPTHIDQSVLLRPGIDDIQYPYPYENHLEFPYNPATGAWT
jgi:hypothetical protein